MRWKGPLFAVVALLLALSVAGLVVNKLWHNSLAAEAEKTKVAIEKAEAFERIGQMAAKHAQKEREEAQAHIRRAAQREAAAAAAIERADSLLAWAPDTCRPYIQAERDARTELQKALDEQKRATARLLGAATADSTAHAALLEGIGTATDAAQDLVDATEVSFFKRILPNVFVGVTAGITPQGEFEVVAGLGAGWEF